jgi:hypothetical protein
MKDRHVRESADHDASWTVEPKQRQYNRSPQKLRILRRQQLLLVTSHRFDEAAQVRGIADRVARAETAEHHRKMQAEFEASRVLLDHKHAEELDTLVQTCELKRGEFKFIKERLTKRFNNRFIALKAEEDTAKDPEKVWARFHRNDGDQVVHLCGTTRRAVLVPKKANVATFNTLPLPPLAGETGGRRRNRFRGSAPKTD